MLLFEFVEHDSMPRKESWPVGHPAWREVDVLRARIPDIYFRHHGVHVSLDEIVVAVAVRVAEMQNTRLAADAKDRRDESALLARGQILYVFLQPMTSSLPPTGLSVLHDGQPRNFARFG
jgi:hypothetical protein